MPFGPWFQLAAACLIVHMVITWVIKGIVFCRQLQHSWDEKLAEDGSQQGWVQWVALVTSIMAASYFIAQIVPFFVDLIDLLGASLSPVVCFLLPITFYCRQLKDIGNKEDRPSCCEWVVIILELMFSIALFLFGTISA